MAIATSHHLLLKRRTKIVATLGPASQDAANVARLTAAGANAFRLNMSHGERSQHRAAYEHVRAAAEENDAATAVIADIGGRAMRVGRFAGGAALLVSGEAVTLTARPVEGDRGLIPVRSPRILRAVRPGNAILLADGRLELRVVAVEGDDVRCTVVRGGELRDRKGINLPGVPLPGPALEGEDADDAHFALQLGVDFLALSHVTSAAAVRELQALIRESGSRAKVIAKIERREALADFDAIVAAADAIMIARGDLGVDLPLEQIPLVQRQLIDQSRAAHKPVIVATQMLESMVENAVPTRAEVADVCASVLGGTDAVMLSAESAIGAHPVAAVAMLDRIAREAEGYLWEQRAFAELERPPSAPAPLPVREAVALSTADLSRRLRARAVVVVAEGDVSAVTVSSARPAAPVLALSHDHRTCRCENLLWGVIPVFCEGTDIARPEPTSRKLASSLGLARQGDPIVLVRGDNVEGGMRTPSITLLTV